MSTLIALVILTILGLASSASVGVMDTCKQPEFSDGNYPHPDNCDQFIQCNNAVTIVLDCPGGMVFNEDKRLCDQLSNVPRCQPTTTEMSTMTRPTYPTKCVEKLDIIFVIDGSSSILKTDFENQISSVKILINSLAVSDQEIHAGLVVFSVVVHDHVYLTGNKAYLLSLNIPYPGGGTATYLGIDVATSDFAANARNGDVPKLMMIITDGQSNRNLSVAAAVRAKAAGINIFSVGVGSVDRYELELLASTPNQVIVTGDFTELEKTLIDAADTACVTLNINDTCKLYGYADGSYIHPTNCQKYLQCNNGITTILDCPANLVFNEIRGLCDDIDKVPRCQPAITPFPDLTTFNPFDIMNTCRLPGHTDGLHIHPHDCHKYILCVSGVIGILDCPVGLVYNEVKKFCDLVVHVPRCQNGVVSTISPAGYSTYCRDNNLPTGIHPDPFSCLHFIECTFGRTDHMPCPDGTAFEVQAMTCEDRAVVDCHQVVVG